MITLNHTKLLSLTPPMACPPSMGMLLLSLQASLPKRDAHHSWFNSSASQICSAAQGAAARAVTPSLIPATHFCAFPSLKHSSASTNLTRQKIFHLLSDISLIRSPRRVPVPKSQPAKSPMSVPRGSKTQSREFSIILTHQTMSCNSKKN